MENDCAAVFDDYNNPYTLTFVLDRLAILSITNDVETRKASIFVNGII